MCVYRKLGKRVVFQVYTYVPFLFEVIECVFEQLNLTNRGPGEVGQTKKLPSLNFTFHSSTKVSRGIECGHNVWKTVQRHKQVSYIKSDPIWPGDEATASFFTLGSTTLDLLII